MTELTTLLRDVPELQDMLRGTMRVLRGDRYKDVTYKRRDIAVRDHSPEVKMSIVLDDKTDRFLVERGWLDDVLVFENVPLKEQAND